MPRHLTRHRLRGLYVLTDAVLGGGHLAVTQAALAGGAAIVQLRDKGTALSQLLPIALEMRRLTLDAGALLIVNDRIDLALAVAADGVHLGSDDLPPPAARRALGPHALIGVSCGDAAQAAQAARQGADYIGAGAVYTTATKADAGASIGLHGLRCIVAATALPVAAIGGLDAANVAAVMRTGAAMACVVAAVAKAGDAAAMTAATRELARLAGRV